ncbi:hypothetical protein C8046_10165 [Serinibacter arcticus]|uniref:Uncharacterized protein n=1 Tax=Serinibacter arcticus TaxID=1655435 RepID=A0A2U1ZVJ2_9MICO|nr:hypothetical protein [Serinibacter arcticus]PWD50963.1 hypothetical protein C8046_10165 [Serinibacter arcticus]
MSGGSRGTPAIGGLWISTDTAEIDDLASDFDDAVTHADAALLELRVARGRLVLVAETPDGARATALVAVGAAITAVVEARDRAASRAAALRFASRDYDGAESDPVSAFSWLPLPVLPRTAAILGGAAGEAVTSLADGTPLLPGSRVQAVLSAVPIDVTAGVLQMLPAAPYSAARLRASITLQPPGAPLAPPAASSLADLADRVRLANIDGGGGSATVEIQRIEHTDGTVSWVVATHGTKDGLFALRQPFSVVGNVDAYAGLASAGEDVVLAAMEEAGIPPGDPVVLAAHSQGGMALINLASNPSVRRRFTVAGVATFGSPVGQLPPAGVPTMNVQHAEDGVGSLGGDTGVRPGGSAPEEVWATREVGDLPVAESHSMDHYVETAELIDASNHPALGDWEEAVTPLLAEEGATVTATTYRGSRW